MNDAELPEFTDPEPTPVLLLVARAVLWPMSGTRRARVRDVISGLTALGYLILSPSERAALLADAAEARARAADYWAVLSLFGFEEPVALAAVRSRIQELLVPDRLPNITNALIAAERYAMIDGDHHKQWVIDQMIRALLGDETYASWREAYNAASPEHEPWSEGIAP